MSQPIRFKVHVSAGGSVTITGPEEHPVTAQPPPLVSIPKFFAREESVAPPAPWEPKHTFLWLLCSDIAEIQEVWALYEKIYKKGKYNDGDLKALGRFLFDKLIGGAVWDEITTGVGESEPFELALLFDPEVQGLHRFNWELMYDGNAFLATRRVAITRLVQRQVQDKPRRFPRPPRVLFVIGTSYTDSKVRPGAEYFGLMRQLEADGLTIHPRVLQLASPRDIRRAMQDFGPDLVHFIGHGDIDRDGQNRLRGCLQLQHESKDKTVLRFADDLLEDLQAGGRLPPIVVFSACHSGSLPFSGVAQMGSLAAEMVDGGVPLVVGMGGSISDAACRLFTRRFGEAVIAGESLVAATAEGRRAAFLDRTPQTIDWAFPALFMAEDVEAAYVPVKVIPGQRDPGKVLNDRLSIYGIPRHPVFCARYKFFDRFYDLLSKSGRRVLAVWTAQNQVGIGRTRLLQELAAQALREGHIPVLVTSREADWEPRNLMQFSAAFLRAIKTARAAFDLEPNLDSSLLALLLLAKPYLNYEDAKQALDSDTLFELVLTHFEDASEPVSAQAVKSAMRRELATLLHDLGQVPGQLSEDARAVVLLDQVHEYGDAIEPLFRVLIDDFGMGTKDQFVPVILCYSKGPPAGDTLRAAMEGNSIKWWQEELTAFREDYEDMMAYEQVMLHPDRGNQAAQLLSQIVREEYEEIEGELISFAYNRRAAQGVVEKWTDKFRRRLRGLPGRLATDMMYVTIEDALDVDFLVPADDDAKLRKLREQE
jgi:hypothetical protein